MGKNMPMHLLLRLFVSFVYHPILGGIPQFQD